jgi:hypothetical protein
MSAMPEPCAPMEFPHVNARAAMLVAVTMVVGVLVMVETFLEWLEEFGSIVLNERRRLQLRACICSAPSCRVLQARHAVSVSPWSL